MQYRAGAVLHIPYLRIIGPVISLHLTLQDAQILLADDELNCWQAVVGHAECQMDELHEIVPTWRSGVTGRMAMPLSDVVDHACSARGCFFDRFGKTGDAALE